MSDVFPTGYFGAARFLQDLDPKMRAETVATVIGCGPVGMSAIITALTMVKSVYAIDPVRERLAEAERVGAIPIHADENAKAKLHKATGGRGADIVVEVVGHADALATAIDIIRPGGKISSIGVHGSVLSLHGLLLYSKNVTLAFGRAPVGTVFQDALDVLVAHQDKVAFLGGNLRNLEDAPQAFKDFEARKVHKVVFKLD